MFNHKADSLIQACGFENKAQPLEFVFNHIQEHGIMAEATDVNEYIESMPDKVWLSMCTLACAGKEERTTFMGLAMIECAAQDKDPVELMECPSKCVELMYVAKDTMVKKGVVLLALTGISNFMELQEACDD